MARTSKRKSALKNQEPDKKEKTFKTGLYVRLSIEDKRDRKDSDSIENQIYILKQYAEEKPYLKIQSIYCDNGEKGTNFDRPEFKRLMEDIKAGMINCIVVKDLSRFGRDYIETGNYLEKIFPFLGVRFISINDNYDSFTTNDNDGLIIALKNLMNDIYAKDISRKILSSFQERQEKGNFLGAHIPYGYKRPNDGTYKMIIDEEAASIVRRIFKWKLEEMGDRAIAINLNNMGIPSPSRYKYLKGIWNNIKYSKSIWNPDVIARITKNEVYIGNKVHGREKSSLCEGKKRVNVPKSEWLVIENNHKPIIDKETFDIVQNNRLKIKEKYYEKLDKYKHLTDEEGIFDGLIYCKDCKKKLLRRRKIVNGTIKCYYYTCSTYGRCGKEICQSKYITEINLTNIIISAIKKELMLVESIEEILKNVKLKKEIHSEENIIKNEINKTKKELERILSIKNNLYDDYLDNIFTEREYLFAKSKYENNQKYNLEKLETLILKQSKYTQTYTPNNKWLIAFDTFKVDNVLTKEIVSSLIHSIEVTTNKSVEITFNFKDEYIELLNYLHLKGIEVTVNA